MTAAASLTPTLDVMEHFQIIFDYFNEALFSNELSRDCMLSFATHGRSKAFFSPARWTKNGDRITAHELSLNPTLLNEPKESALAWLARLMVQLWQSEHGITQSQSSIQKRYLNVEFSEKMASIGLPCSKDGTPNGEKMGYSMTHWVEKGGAFQNAVNDMPDDYFPWKGDIKPKPPKKSPYIYLCNVCGARFSITLQLHLTCNTKACNEVMELIGQDANSL